MSTPLAPHPAFAPDLREEEIATSWTEMGERRYKRDADGFEVYHKGATKLYKLVLSGAIALIDRNWLRTHYDQDSTS